MRTNQIFKTDSLDTVTPVTNILDSPNNEGCSDYNTRWHFIRSPMESYKSAKTVKYANHLENQGNQSKHFF